MKKGVRSMGVYTWGGGMEGVGSVLSSITPVSELIKYMTYQTI